MAEWISPTGHLPGSGWADEIKAYDDDTDTRAYINVPEGTWSPFIILTHTAILCTKIRFYAYHSSYWVDEVDVDIHYAGFWHNLYQGSFEGMEWVEKAIGSSQTVSNMRFRFHCFAGNGDGRAELYEAELYSLTISVPPTVTTQAVTDILSTTATGNGNITATGIGDDGVIVSKRGICWNTTGSPTVADNKSEETGDFGTGAFTRPITELLPGTHYYVRAYAYNNKGYGYGEEVEFTTDMVVPEVTTQDVTDILATTGTARGTITNLGGENSTVRGFEYGLTKTPTWEVHDNGDFGLGAFTKSLVGLTGNTTYWIRAYATNSIGTSYGEWIQFQTSASGIIPTGTLLYIAADLAGYSYQVMKSETDDGYPYTAYFVISTDLTNKQGLAYYKRILDLYLYFRSESSGTAKIEVKRDNEAEWQTVGTVSLVGEADIICLLYTSPSPRDATLSRMPSSA